MESVRVQRNQQEKREVSKNIIEPNENDQYMFFRNLTSKASKKIEMPQIFVDNVLKKLNYQEMYFGKEQLNVGQQSNSQNSNNQSTEKEVAASSMEEVPMSEEQVLSPRKIDQNLNELLKAESLVDRKKKNARKHKIQGLSENEKVYGEQQIMKIGQLKCDCNPSLKVPTLEGDFIVTNYKIVFKYLPMYFTDPLGKQQEFRFPKFLNDYLSIPLTYIHRIEKSSYDKKTNKINQLEIYTKDYRSVKIIFENSEDCNNVYMRIQIIAFKENEMNDIFAFQYYEPENQNQENGWTIYQTPQNEFQRQGIDFNNQNPTLRIYINEEYKVCPSYPRVNVIPNNITDETLLQCSRFRTKSRFPSNIQYDYYNLFQAQHTMTRTRNVPFGDRPRQWQQYPIQQSKIQTGFLTSRNLEDESMLQEISKINPNNPNKLIIYDARSYLNALANRVNRGGYENTDNYNNSEIVFCDIDNIHNVRDSINKVYDLAQSDIPTATMQDNTNWLQIIAKILIATNNILETIIQKQCNVLVHCTDGWDRTAQLCSLSQIMLDPFFRTIKGFEILIEKDWLSFGHQFQRRLGHFDKNYKDDQRCPIFIQFLDCVYQIMKFFPNQFEFNKEFLTFIAHEVFSCKYGTFLCNNERERTKYKLREKTESIWTYINSNTSKFQNSFYEKDTQAQLQQIPLKTYYDLKLWKRLYFKYSTHQLSNNSFYSQKYPGVRSPTDIKEQMMKFQQKANSILFDLYTSSQELLKKIDQNAFQQQQPIKNRIQQQQDLNISSFEIIRKSDAAFQHNNHGVSFAEITGRRQHRAEDSQEVSIIESEDENEEGLQDNSELNNLSIQSRYIE